jgi:hypothetical protein
MTHLLAESVDLRLESNRHAFSCTSQAKHAPEDVSGKLAGRNGERFGNL